MESLAVYSRGSWEALPVTMRTKHPFGMVLLAFAAIGGAVRLLTSQVASAASGLAVIGSQVVMTEGNGMVVAVPVGGGPPKTLATQQPNASFPLACGSDVYWWTGAAPNPWSTTGQARSRASMRTGP